MPVAATPVSRRGSPAEVLSAFLRLGCMSFGGPIAHLGYFRTELVHRRGWVSDQLFAELVALAQSMPGPASSQVAYALGLIRAGWPGGVAAWVGFTMPSALLMVAFAFGRQVFSGRTGAALLHGLQLVTVAVVAQAVVSMQAKLAPDRLRLALALVAVGITLLAPASLGTFLAIAFGTVAGLVLMREGASTHEEKPLEISVSRTVGIVAAVGFVLLLAALVLPVPLGTPTGWSVFTAFGRTGALVFGGGHVVLPLLEEVTVAKGWISQQSFLSGYGAAQALPGPLFSFAAYLGAAVQPNPHPLLLGLCALVSIFLPGLLLFTAVLPFWSRIRQRQVVQAAIRGIHASVVGVLIAALYNPVWTSSIHTGSDFWIALTAFALLTVWGVQPLLLVLGVCAFCWLRSALV
jgi:chromate transporter